MAPSPKLNNHLISFIAFAFEQFKQFNRNDNVQNVSISNYIQDRLLAQERKKEKKRKGGYAGENPFFGLIARLAITEMHRTKIGKKGFARGVEVTPKIKLKFLFIKKKKKKNGRKRG